MSEKPGWRCETCKCWIEDDIGCEDGWGWCRLDPPMAVGPDGDTDIQTSPVFGCVQWDAREE